MTFLLIIGGAAVLVGGGVLFLRRVWFYRDPLRIPPDDPRAILAPADGKLVYARRFADGKVFSEKLGESIHVSEVSKTDFAEGESGWIMGIYMTPLDVHYNYAPVAGTVSRVVHTPASVNLPMIDMWEYVRLTYLRKAIDLFGRKYQLANERTTVFVDAGPLRIAVVEIADKFINKIRCFVHEGEHVEAGQKISFIERGSQVDLVIPGDSVEVVAKVGQQVYGAKTVIARIKDDSSSAKRRMRLPAARAVMYVREERSSDVVD